MTVEERIITILSKLTTTPASKIRLQDRLRADLGLDSVASMELLGMLSEELEIEVPMEETVGLERVEELVVLAQRHLPHA